MNVDRKRREGRSSPRPGQFGYGQVSSCTSAAGEAQGAVALRFEVLLRTRMRTMSSAWRPIAKPDVHDPCHSDPIASSEQLPLDVITGRRENPRPVLRTLAGHIADPKLRVLSRRR